MVYTPKIKDAVRFCIQVHEIDKGQKRKGKNIPYITHPLTVGIILARAGAGEDVIAAGILHDTVEDSDEKYKVTPGMLRDKFGDHVSELVMSVTEESKELSWEERKQEALEHIKLFSHDSLLVKAADVISNVSEILDDYAQIGEEVFNRFNKPKEMIIKNYVAVMSTILEQWGENPLAEDLKGLIERFLKLSFA
jgi:(p)ppGpp synthase/HD superfamily hydrolase